MRSSTTVTTAGHPPSTRYPQGAGKRPGKASFMVPGPISVKLPPSQPLSPLARPPKDGRPLDMDAPTILPLWSQTAPRDFVSYSICFPFENSDSPVAREAARAHLLRSYARLAESRPEFAGSLRLSAASDQPGWLVWHRHREKTVSVAPDAPEDGIYATFEDISDIFGHTYDELRQRGFPPATFTHGRFALAINANPAEPGAQTNNPAGAGATGAAPKQNAVPVLIVRTFFIKGGLLLLTHLHHAFGDGECMRILLECLSAATRSEAIKHPPGWTLGLPDIVKGATDMAGKGPEALAKDCPEYHYVANRMVGPTQPVLREGGQDMSKLATDARVFVFSEAKLLELRKQLMAPTGAGETTDAGMPSIYVSISALTWAHVALARFTAEDQASSITTPNNDATLMNPVNWIKRMKTIEETSGAAAAAAAPRHGIVGNGPARPVRVDEYFGNATTKCLTTFPAERLLAAARDRDLSQLRDLAAAIRQSISAVDRPYVDARTRLYGALMDYRALGLEDDPRVWHDLQVNTWRPFGGDAVFEIPGVGVRRPDSIRKALVGGRCDYRNAIILPAPEGSTDHELFVSLPKVALEALCNDPGFMMWVDREIR